MSKLYEQIIQCLHTILSIDFNCVVSFAIVELRRNKGVGCVVQKCVTLTEWFVGMETFLVTLLYAKQTEAWSGEIQICWNHWPTQSGEMQTCWNHCLALSCGPWRLVTRLQYHMQIACTMYVFYNVWKTLHLVSITIGPSNDKCSHTCTPCGEAPRSWLAPLTHFWLLSDLYLELPHLFMFQIKFSYFHAV